MHPHIAPLSSSPPGNFSRPPGTPQFNIADLAWNNGEGFIANSTNDADYGGHLGYAATGGVMQVGVELGDIFDAGPVYLGPSGWHPYTWTHPKTGQQYPMKRFVGYLRPGQLGAYATGTAILDAAFELFAPDFGPSGTEPPGNKLVVALGGYATTGSLSIEQGGRFAYPGTRPDGLAGPWPGEPYRAGGPSFVAKAPSGYTVIGGYIVTRIFGRPEVFALQRTRELRKAIEIMLKQPEIPNDPAGLHPPACGCSAPTTPSVAWWVAAPSAR